MGIRKNKRAVCADGFSVSVQAHHGAYCTPRTDNAERYTAVELGYPTESDSLIIEYAESPDKPTETVYGYVPSELIYILLEKHGGMVDGEVPKGVFYYGGLERKDESR